MKRLKSKIKSIISFVLHGEPDIYTANIVKLHPNELLKGRCALITGGTSGIGFFIAEAFLNAGAKVIITGRNFEKITKAKDTLSKLGEVYALEMDNTSVDSINRGVEKALNIVNQYNLEKIDILVNNAGINGGHLPNSTEKQYDDVMDTNLKGLFFISQTISKYMVDNKIKGNILNVASSSSLRPAVSAYTISKWGVRGLTLGLAKSLAPYGITVNGIAPGQTLTPMMGKDINNTNLINENIPIRRWIKPEEIANGALFLVSDMGRTVVGDILYMTGGAGLLSYEDVNYKIF